MINCPPVNNCPTTSTACDKYTPAKCIYYSGAALSCSGINYNDSIDFAIKKLNDKLCNVANQTIVYSSTSAIFREFTIGDSDSLMDEGDVQLIIFDANVAVDSVWITLGGSELPRKPIDTQAYTPIYTASQVTINFLEPVSNGNRFIIHYLVNNATINNISFGRIQFKIGQSGAQMIAGDTVLTIADDNIIPATLSVIVNDVPIPRNDDGNHGDQLSYLTSFNGSNTVLTFSDPATTNQTYLITYAKTIAS